MNERETRPSLMRAGVVVLCAVSLLAALTTRGAARGVLRVGAARLDITPAPDAALPMAGYGGRTGGFRGIHDPLYVRAIVLDDGTTQVALVAWESLFVPDAVWSDKTVTVLRFDDLGGTPLAFWINYPVHAVVMGPNNSQILELIGRR